MKILHGYWIPTKNSSIDHSPTLFLWIEDITKASKGLQKHLINSENTNIDTDNSINTNAPKNIHPFVLADNKIQKQLENNLSSVFQQQNIELETKQMTINLKLPTIQNFPVPLEYFRYIQHRYEYSKQEQIQMDQLHKYVKPYLSDNKNLDTNDGSQLDDDDQSILETSLITLRGLIVPPEDIPKLLNLILFYNMNKDEDIDSEIRLSDDLWYICKVNQWVQQQIYNRNIVPTLLKRKEVNSLLGLEVENDEVYMGWWVFRRSIEQKNEILEFIANIPEILLQEFNLRENAENKVNTDTSIKNNSYSIFTDLTSWLLNIVIRTKEKDELAVNLTEFTTSEYFEIYFEQALKSLTTTNSIFSTSTSDDIEWFIQKFNSWVTGEENRSFDVTNWQLSLVLIPPEESPQDTWYLSFLLRNRIDTSQILTVNQLFSFDDEIISHPVLDSKAVRTIFHYHISSLLDEISEIKSIISKSEIEPFIALTHQNLGRLLGELGTKIRSLGYEVYLPRNVKHKFIPKEKIDLELNIDVSNKTKLKVMNYDLNVMIEGESYDIAEIIKMAESKSGLVEIKGKWVHFDPTEAEEIKNLIETQLKEPNIFDILKIDSGQSIGNGEAQFFSGEINLQSNLISELNEQYDPSALELKHLNATLRDYQRVGVQWLQTRAAWGLGGILADDMGLGKTIQTIALLLQLHIKNELGPTLIAVPTSVLGNWIDEFDRFAPDLKYIVHHGQDRSSTLSNFKQSVKTNPIVLTSYNLVRIDFKLIKEISWQAIILDEGQKIKNPQTKLHRALTNLEAKFRFTLTGTPIENRLQELWSLFDFLLPGYLGNKNKFKSEFIDPIEKDQNTTRTKLLQRLISPFILRRYKTDNKIIDDLPDKVEKKVYCAMTKEQIALYKAITDNSLQKLQSSDGIRRRGVILSTMTKLKQVCNHPENYIQEETDTSITRSGKFRALIDILENIFDANEKVLIFSQYRVMCKLLLSLIEKKFDVPAFYLHGGVRQSKRQEMIDQFNETIGSGVFIISIRAGGTGLNLYSANHVIHYDRWWNPAVETQASDRAYRIGQRKDVMVYKLITKGTIEEQIDTIIEDKRDLTDQIIGGLQQDFTSLDDAELENLLQLRSILTE